LPPPWPVNGARAIAPWKSGGTGELGRRLAKAGVRSTGSTLAPPGGLAVGSSLAPADLRQFEGYGDYEIIIANLVLHQLDDRELAALGRRWTGGCG